MINGNLKDGEIMTTAKRVWYEGAAYHITARGNHRNDIFRDDEDFQYYLTVIGEALLYYGINNYQLICYCLMDNHVHLMIKTENKPLANLISRISSIYTKYFNKKYHYIGHLFQDRYYSELIEDDKQMLETSRYVHLNPVRANMVEVPKEYKWSSYTMFIGEKEEKLINADIVLKYFKYDNKHKLYQEFVESKIKENLQEIKKLSHNNV